MIPKRYRFYVEAHGMRYWFVKPPKRVRGGFIDSTGKRLIGRSVALFTRSGVKL